MLHRATIVEVLFETDCPEIVVARDGAGYSYLSVLSARTPGGDQFLCVPISAPRLVAFRKGKVDLRELLDSPESIVYSADFHRDGATQYLHLEPLEDIPSEWLPESGFLLIDLDKDAVPVGQASTLEVRANQGRVFAGVLKLNPPEAALEPRINVYHLATGIRLFQDLVQRAGDKVRAGFKDTERKVLAGPENFDLHVLPAFTAGSFEVHIESRPASGANLWGRTIVGEALDKVDEITRYIDDPESALPVFRQNTGHIIRAYQAMLKFVATEKIPMAYRWADPGQPETSHPISVDSAQRTYDVLTARQELTSVEVEHTGRFINLGEKGGAGTWKLSVGDNKSVKGETLPELGDLLGGITFRTQLYRLKCDERIDESIVSGKARRLYYLKEAPIPV